MASNIFIVGKSHIAEIKDHNFISESSILPSAQIKVPKKAVTYFFSSAVILETT